MNEYRSIPRSLSKDIGTPADWVIGLALYFTVVACLIIPIAMTAKAHAMAGESAPAAAYTAGHATGEP
jgi:hypothetical protein